MDAARDANACERPAMNGLLSEKRACKGTVVSSRLGVWRSGFAKSNTL
jgi:hypothetical protein